MNLQERRALAHRNNQSSQSRLNHAPSRPQQETKVETKYFINQENKKVTAAYSQMLDNMTFDLPQLQSHIETLVTVARMIDPDFLKGKF